MGIESGFEKAAAAGTDKSGTDKVNSTHNRTEYGLDYANDDDTDYAKDYPMDCVKDHPINYEKNWDKPPPLIDPLFAYEGKLEFCWTF